MDSKLDRQFPSLDRIEKAALNRLPRFLSDYIYQGMGNGLSVQRNIDSISRVNLLPRYALAPGEIDLTTRLLGETWQAPFGIAPVGLGGFAWPAAAELLAVSAQKFGIPFCASTFALASLEKLRQCAGESAWFQLYRPNVGEVEADLLNRARTAGYRTLLVTVDIPAAMRRSHDIANGFTIPPQIDWFTLGEILAHPVWSFAQARHLVRHGLPKFDTLEPYVPTDLNINQATQYMSDLTIGNISIDVIRHLRDAWPGKLIVKGVLDPEDAQIYQDQGVDCIWVSNHGGRQLEAAPSALEMLPDIRRAVGSELPLIVDGGVRSGIDICRMLASGADFVMLGRPFYYAMAAMGDRGADHIVEMLIAETHCALGQLGCASIAELPERLMS